jgi:arsenate reductase
MAEGWAHHLKADIFTAFSAGVVKHGLNPLAVQAMAEEGVDIQCQTSKTTDELPADVIFDYVITVCDSAHEQCPFFPAKTRVVHVGFDDPPALAKTAANDEEAMVHYRRVRDEIRKFIETLPEGLGR